MADPGLTDLIAAEIKKFLFNRFWGISTSEAEVRAFGNGQINVTELADALTLVVEQHTNERITELEAELEKQKRGGRTLGKTIDRTLKDVVAAVGVEDMIDEDGDGDYAAVFEKLFELRPARDAAIARAEKAEATITRVRAYADELGKSGPKYSLHAGLVERSLRAALEGEQQ